MPRSEVCTKFKKNTEETQVRLVMQDPERAGTREEKAPVLEQMKNHYESTSPRRAELLR